MIAPIAPAADGPYATGTVRRAINTWLLAATVLGSTGCVEKQSQQTDPCADVEDQEPTFAPVTFANQIDVLFIVDNSGSMLEEQEKQTEGMGAFMEALDLASEVELDMRIGVTTTDMGNVECTGTSPENGQMRLVPASQRFDEFCWPKLNPIGCDNGYFVLGRLCPSQVGEALSVVPTSLGAEDPPAPRSWLERTGGTLNVEGGTFDQAIDCYVPQGVDGCGFESPLEAMRAAIVASDDPDSVNFGFFRRDATKLVFFLTDEYDSSANPDLQAAVFDRTLSAEQKVFWEDPQGSIPTSAIAWNAGVECSGSGMPYEECHSSDLGVDGEEVEPSAAETDAVLFPVARYVAVLQSIVPEDPVGPPRLIVGGLMGVPPGFDGADTDVVYRESDDQAVSDNFGIDYGCLTDDSGPVQTAFPPVRMREVVEAMGGEDEPTALHSICSNHYAPALVNLAIRAGALGHGGCYMGPVEDQDAMTAGVQPKCSVTATSLDDDAFDVPPCNSKGKVPKGASQCHRVHEPTTTPCIRAQATLEFEVVTRPGELPPRDARYAAACAEPTQTDCG